MIRTDPRAGELAEANSFVTMFVSAGESPVVVPLAWMGVNLANQDSPFYFARESARIFKSAYGGFDGRARRLVYYPISLLRAAPLLLVLEGVVAFMRRRQRIQAVCHGPPPQFRVLLRPVRLRPRDGDGPVPGRQHSIALINHHAFNAGRADINTQEAHILCILRDGDIVL